jgi:hypothetical protein
MADPVNRIRWEPSAATGSLLGYVGALPGWVFQIWQPPGPWRSAAGRWRLMTQLPGLAPVDPTARADGPDDLKPRAEAQLLRFAALIGAELNPTGRPATAQPAAHWVWPEERNTS